MFVVPLGTHTTRFAMCTVCGAEFLCKVDLAVLHGLGPADVARHMVLRVSLVNKTLALVSILFAWAPGFGVVLALIAFTLTRHRAHWTRTCSKIGLLLSALFAAAILISILSENA
jgi:hypothetical protein